MTRRRTSRARSPAREGKPVTVLVSQRRRQVAARPGRAGRGPTTASTGSASSSAASRSAAARRPSGSRSSSPGASRREIGVSLGNLVHGEGRKQISSPVGIVQSSSTALNEGVQHYLSVLALISLSLGAAQPAAAAAARRRPHRLLARRGDPRPRGQARGLRARLRGRDRPRVLLFFVGLSNDIGRLGGG